jgi:hypothetical protein
MPILKFMKSYLNALFCAVAVGILASPVFAADTSAQSAADSPLGGKSYQIRSRQYGELLRPQDANNANGTPIVLYPAQPWKCMTWKLSPAGESQFCLQNHFTSKTFAASQKEGDSIVFVTQVPFGKPSDERPIWQFTKLQDGTFKIVDAKSGNVLTARKSPTDSDVKVVLQAWADRDSQKWTLQEIDPAKLTM